MGYHGIEMLGINLEHIKFKVKTVNNVMDVNGFIVASDAFCLRCPGAGMSGLLLNVSLMGKVES